MRDAVCWRSMANDRGAVPTESKMRIYGHRRLLTFFAVLTSLALLAGACGGDDGEGHRLPARRREDRVELDRLRGEAFQAVIDAFHEKSPKVTVKVEQVPFDQTRALLPAVRGRLARTWPWPARHHPHLRRPGPAAQPRPAVGRLDQGRRLPTPCARSPPAPTARRTPSSSKGNVGALVWYSLAAREARIAEPRPGPSSPRPWTRPRPTAWPLAVGAGAGRSPSGRPGHPARRRRRGLQHDLARGKSAGTTRGSSSRSRCSAT